MSGGVLFAADAELMRFCRAYMRCVESGGVRVGDLMLLDVLCRCAGPHTPVTLADRFGVSKPMIAARLAGLERDGFIVRVPSPEDKRSVYIMPTKKCVDVMGRVEQSMGAQRIAKKMGEKKFERFMSLVVLANRALGVGDESGA